MEQSHINILLIVIVGGLVAIEILDSILLKLLKKQIDLIAEYVGLKK